jgi:hypothetical protein
MPKLFARVRRFRRQIRAIGLPLAGEVGHGVAKRKQ